MIAGREELLCECFFSLWCSRVDGSFHETRSFDEQGMGALFVSLLGPLGSDAANDFQREPWDGVRAYTHSSAIMCPEMGVMKFIA